MAGLWGGRRRTGKSKRRSLRDDKPKEQATATAKIAARARTGWGRASLPTHRKVRDEWGTRSVGVVEENGKGKSKGTGKNKDKGDHFSF
jgi:hypothetical protein